MTSAKPLTLGHLPDALYCHPAWVSWKESQGWRLVGWLNGYPFLSRAIDPDNSMVYTVCPLNSDNGDNVDFGQRLEALSLRALSFIPSNCAFIRWDLMVPLWKDAQGNSLPKRLLEFRMNAATQQRCLRKAAKEHTSLETIVVEFQDGWPAVTARMAARTRYTVRLAQRRGTRVVKVGEAGFETFYNQVKATALRRGLYLHSEACYRELFQAARGSGLTLELYLAFTPGQVAAASAVFARIHSEAWYLFAASDPAQRVAAGPTAILYQALQDCAASGCQRMDLLGVAPPDAPNHPLAGLSLFKSGFGGRRRSRAGAWDYLLKPAVYSAYRQVEAVLMA